MTLLILLVIICSVLLSAGCATLEPKRVLSVGDEVEGTLKEPGAVVRWSFRTTSDTEVVTFHVAGDGKVPLQGVQTRVLLPGDALAAQLATRDQEEFGAAIVGRATTWTVELKLEESVTRPVQYRFRVGHWRASGSALQSPCETTLQSLGIKAFIMLLPNVPNPYTVTNPTLGTFTFAYDPPSAAQLAPHLPGAIPTLRMGGGSAIKVDLTGLYCDVFKFQMNLWDTERGPRPAITPLDATGSTLCGGSGQPACLSNPPQAQWTSYTLNTNKATDTVLVECEEVNISTFVLMQ